MTPTPISLLVVAAHGLPAFLAGAADVSTLRPGQRVEHALRSGEAASYQVVLDEAGVVPLVVRQEGIDVAVTVTGPRGAARTIDVSARLAWGDEPASLGPESGTWRMDIRAAADPAAASGRVVVEAAEWRAADADARRRLAAETDLAAAAGAARTAGTPEAVTAALARLEGSVAAWRALGDEYWTLVSLRVLARLQVGLDPPAALDGAQEAIEGFAALGRDAERAAALHTASIALYYVGEPEAALVPGLEARAIFRELADAAAEAEAIDDVGMVHLEMGRIQDSSRAREEALRLARSVQSVEREAAALANLGTTDWFTGEIDKAHERFVLAGESLRALGNLLGVAATSHNIAMCEMFLGETLRAEARLREALPACRGAADRPCEASVLLMLAINLDQQGRLEEALRHYEEARVIRRALADEEGEAWLLISQAMTHHRHGARDRAAELARVAEGIYGPMGGWKAAVLRDLQGQLAFEAGDVAGAEARHREALALRTAIGDREGQASSLVRLGRLARAKGRPEEARADAERAVLLLESIRGRVQSPERRMGFMMGSVFWPSLRDAYEELADALVEMHASDATRGYDALAFEASERSRARVLQEALSRPPGEPRSSGEPDLRGEARALEDRLAFKLDEQVRVLSAAPSEKQRQRLAAEVDALTREVEKARTRARAAAPREDAWSTRRASLPEVQRELEGADTLLLEYSLGERRSHLWAVTATSLRSFVLPPRRAIEDAVRAAHAAVGVEPVRRAQGEVELASLARLLLEPVAPLLERRRLVFVPDGALHFVPFGALPDPVHPSRPLGEGHELVTLPSASVLTLLRASRPSARPAAGTVAVVADPVYDADDERIAGRRRARRVRTIGDRATRAVDAMGFAGPIPRLPFTRREASAIRALVPGHSAFVALDFEASRATLMDPKLSRYRIVHVAAHGLVNASRPELSGILLSQYDREGRPQPGFFTAADALHLDLPADLVVLSGCRTALGREMKGEGIVGLARGFLYAGAQRVVASLWKVDDAATAALMERFYDALLGPRRLAPAAALRAAQLELRRQPRYRHPYYWAGFQLVGEWN